MLTLRISSTSTLVINIMLFSLPLELLAFILNYLVYCIRIYYSVYLRLVCRNFDKCILDTIYALPTFETLSGSNTNYLT